MDHRLAVAFRFRKAAQLVERVAQVVIDVVPGYPTTAAHPRQASTWNTGKMIARVVNKQQALDCDYTVVHPTYTTHHDYMQLFARAVGEEPVLVHIPSDLILARPGTEDSLLRVLTGFNVAFSTERFSVHYPDFQWSLSLNQAAKDYIIFHDNIGDFPAADEEILDDRLIRAWKYRTKCFIQTMTNLHQ